MSDWPPPPRWLVWLSAVLVLCSAILGVVGAVRIGVTVDETFHLVRMRNYLEHGWYLLDDNLTASGRPGEWVGDTFVYAPLTAAYLHTLNWLFGNESWGTVSGASDAYMVRHLGIVLIGLLTAAATAAIARIVSGHWGWGLIAAAILMVVPMWTGHAMFNVKDVPVAAGYTFVTLGSMLCVAVSKHVAKVRIARVSLILGGLTLAVGTRPAIWPGVAVTLMAAVTVAYVMRKRHGIRSGEVAVDVAGALLASFTILLLVYPNAFADLPRLLMDSPGQSAGYQGRRYPWYIPVMVLCTMPLLLLAIGFWGLTRAARGWWPTRRLPDRPRDFLFLLVALQALLLPSLLTLRSSAFNGGLRHVLFALPAVAVLLAMGISSIIARSHEGGRVRPGPCLVALGLLLPAVAQVQLFPLGYGYVNPLTDAVRVGFIPDFWQASFRQLASIVPRGAFVVCGARLDENGRPLRLMVEGFQSPLDLSRDCSRQGALSVVQPFLPREEPARAPWEVAEEFVALVVYDDPSPKGCRELGSTSRWRFLTEVTASRALACPLNVNAYDGPIAFDGAGSGADFLLGGWTARGGDPWIQVDSDASVGFELLVPPEQVRLRVTGSTEGVAEFRLNNQVADVNSTPDGWIVSSRGPIGFLGDPGNVVLTMSVRGGIGRVSELELEEVRR